MKRREFVGASLALAAAAPLRGWTAILKDVGDVAAKSLDGADLNLPGSAVADFAAGLNGDLLLQGNPAYDARRRVWNGLFDRKPALIACCTGAADVRRAVDFARDLFAQVPQHDFDVVARVSEDDRRHARPHEIRPEHDGLFDVTRADAELRVDDRRVEQKEATLRLRRAALGDEVDFFRLETEEARSVRARMSSMPRW